MLGGHENLEYKPRKKVDPNKKTLTEKIADSFSNLFGGHRSNSDVTKPPKPKSRKQVEREQMDEYYIDFDYEKPNQQLMILPPSEKELKKQQEVAALMQGKPASASAATLLKDSSLSNIGPNSSATNVQPASTVTGNIAMNTGYNDVKIIKGAPLASIQVTIPRPNTGEFSCSPDLFNHPSRAHIKQQSAVSLVSIASRFLITRELLLRIYSLQ